MRRENANYLPSEFSRVCLYTSNCDAYCAIIPYSGNWELINTTTTHIMFEDYIILTIVIMEVVRNVRPLEADICPGFPRVTESRGIGSQTFINPVIGT